MKLLWEVIVAGTLGFIFTLGGLLLLTFIAGSAAGQDQTVATRPATLGEQDRSLSYKGSPYTSLQDHGDEYFAYIVEAEATASAQTTLACRQHNLYLQYMLEDIAKTIAKNPKVGSIYEGAIKAINDSWCTE